MQHTWLKEQLETITEPKYHLIIQETLAYITQLEDDNESLQVALEGTIWSPEKWRDSAAKK